MQVGITSRPASNVAYSYDGLDRVARRNATRFTYAGTEIDPVVDGSVTYGRGAAGELVSVTEGGTARLAGLNHHGDLAFTMTATGSVAGPAAYGSCCCSRRGRNVT